MFKKNSVSTMHNKQKNGNQRSENSTETTIAWLAPPYFKIKEIDSLYITHGQKAKPHK